MPYAYGPVQIHDPYACIARKVVCLLMVCPQRILACLYALRISARDITFTNSRQELTARAARAPRGLL